jgi:hypothetical protein
MATRLREQGIPVDLYSVGRRGSDEPDTTLTGYTGNPGEYAGHGSEKSPTHIVIQTGFERLSAQLTKGDPAPCDREFRVDDTPQKVAPDPAQPSAGCTADPLPPAATPAGGACADTLPPARVKARVSRRGGRVTVSGRAADRGCGYVARVQVAVARVAAHRCRFLRARGGFGPARVCTRRSFVSAAGTTAWRLKLGKLRRGRYELRAVAADQGGRRSRLGPVSRFTVR